MAETNNEILSVSVITQDIKLSAEVVADTTDYTSKTYLESSVNVFVQLLKRYDKDCLVNSYNGTFDDWLAVFGGSGSGLTDEEKEALDELVEKDNPLTMSIDSNDGTYEVGDSVTPTATITVKKGKTDVTSKSAITASYGKIDGASFSAPAITAEAAYRFVATYNNKTTDGTIAYLFSHYRYSGPIDNVPADDAALSTTIQSLNYIFSETPTLGATNLAANKYYLFVVVGSHTFEIRENSTNGIVSAEKTGTIIVPRKNGTGSDSYSYVIVPASSMAWTFKIV